MTTRITVLLPTQLSSMNGYRDERNRRNRTHLPSSVVVYRRVWTSRAKTSDALPDRDGDWRAFSQFDSRHPASHAQSRYRVPRRSSTVALRRRVDHLVA